MWEDGGELEEGLRSGFGEGKGGEISRFWATVVLFREDLPRTLPGLNRHSFRATRHK